MVAGGQEGLGAPALDEAHRAALRARLEDERERLQGLLVRLAHDERDAEPAPDEPEDGSDMGWDLTQEDTTQALRGDQERLLARVEHALQRLDAGTYGLSEVSGRPIPRDRLEDLPWATTLVDEPAPR